MLLCYFLLLLSHFTCFFKRLCICDWLCYYIPRQPVDSINVDFELHSNHTSCCILDRSNMFSLQLLTVISYPQLQIGLIVLFIRLACRKQRMYFNFLVGGESLPHPVSIKILVNVNKKKKCCIQILILRYAVGKTQAQIRNGMKQRVQNLDS